MHLLKKSLFTFAILCLLISAASAQRDGSPFVINDSTPIYTSAKPGDALYLAVEALQRDMNKVLGRKNEIRPLSGIDQPGIVIVNTATDTLLPPLTGWEAHRLYTTPIHKKRQVVVQGADTRGTIYAVYTFSEKILGVPPLWYFSAWQPSFKTSITLPASLNIKVNAPSVKYRAWFPNDMDLFEPWRRRDPLHNAMWLEAALRLKLNTIEWFDSERNYRLPYSISPTTRMISNYGLLNTTHHHSPLNASFKGWEDYWRLTRDTAVPPLSLSNTRYLREFWKYNVECIVRNKIPMLWVIGFRGNGDHPFWYTFKDAPASMEERGAVINSMMQLQRQIVQEVTGDADPEFRTIFYDELSDLLAKGFIEPPADPRFIRTYVAARRDHYPNEDVQQLDKQKNYRLGYYFNCQFTSTGSHLAAGEGPWKMEQNYRYIAGKTHQPLAFSVVNAGNIREFVMELSANAAMMWNPDTYTTDAFLIQYCRQYFGVANAGAIAALYRSYYNAYWQQRHADLKEMNRQYIFQDLRYKRAITELAHQYHKGPGQLNPLTDIGAEQFKGRTYRIVPEDNNARDQVGAIITGTAASAKKFLGVKTSAAALMKKLDASHRTFFRDNLLQPASYMYYLNESLLQLARGYKETDIRRKKIYAARAIGALRDAEQALQATATGDFADWYRTDRVFGFREVLKLLEPLAL